MCIQVPCVAVVENMCHFDADGKRYYPFGRGSGSQVLIEDHVSFLACFIRILQDLNAGISSYFVKSRNLKIMKLLNNSFLSKQNPKILRFEMK